MNRIILIIAAVVLMATAAIATEWKVNDGVAFVDNAVKITGGIVADNTTSTAVSVRRGLENVSIKVPTITSAAIRLSVSADDTNYSLLRCFGNGTNTVLWATAADTGGYWVTVPCSLKGFSSFKISASAAQADNVYFTVSQY